MRPVIARYQAALHSRGLQADPAQQRAVSRLDALYDALANRQANRPGLLARLLGHRPDAVKGVYLHGPVGRGKSMVMQLFIEAIQQRNDQHPQQPIRLERRHFHAFMLDLHQQLHAQSLTDAQMQNRLAALADDLAARLDVLCFDEFHVTDVTDAMLLMPYFARLWQRGVVVVATSNFPPADLYKNGLQRARFLPFIALLQEQMAVVAVDGQQDYRQLAWQDEAQKHDHWLQPLTAETQAELTEIFKALVGYDDVGPETLEIPGQDRDIKIARASRHVAWLDVNDVMTGATGAADFIALAARFPVLLLDQITPFAATENDRAKRFMLLIDSLYEAGTQLYARAACAPEDLYAADGRLAFEFARTVSRLQEMRFKTPAK